jgi:uroporphyrin-III C-methyltransferase
MTVYLVGAGPGDPELITVRGLRLLQHADAVVYDELAPAELLAHVPADAVLVSRAGLRQEQINALLVSLGRSYPTVVRLKGGDPFLFGRGREESDALTAAGLDCEVVPGVSALTAVPAAAGIPLTHRGLASQITVVTGHTADDRQLDYRALAHTAGTLVVFMGIARLSALVAGLIAAGRAPDTPAAVISSGSTERQQTIIAPLHQIAAHADGVPSPALVIIGPTAALARDQQTLEPPVGVAAG